MFIINKINLIEYEYKEYKDNIRIGTLELNILLLKYS